MSGRIIHWFDTSLALDADVTGQANDWVNAPGSYIEFGDDNQAMFAIELMVSGPGAADVEMFIERTSLTQIEQEQFEQMNAVAIPLSRGQQWVRYTFGRNPSNNVSTATTGDLGPRGTGRIRLVNTSVTNWAFLTMRVHVALSRYERRA